MINCSHCGIQNREGSKFCSNCGARVTPPSGLVCPMCSTPNPVENVFCSNCGARLIPQTGGGTERSESAPPIRGLSLPAKPASPPPSSSEGEIKEAEPDAGKESGEVTSDVPVTREKIEDWLTKLRDSPPVEDESTPLPPKSPAVTQPTPAFERDLPSWVQQAQSPDQNLSEQSMAEEPASGAEDQAPISPSQDKPDWLKELTGETGFRGAKQPADEHTAPPPFQTSVEELPSWLRIASEEKQEPIEPMPAIQEERQEEISPQPPVIEPVAPEPIEPARAEEIPPWVAEMKPTQYRDQPSTPAHLPSIEAETTPIEPARADEIPAWIAELKPTQDQPTPPSQPLQSEPAAIEPARAQEIPSWIADLKPSAEAPVEPTPEFEAEVHMEELEDWLRTPQVGPAIPMVPLELGGESAEASGPLANLRGILPLATAMAEPHPTVQAPPTEKKDGAHIFEEILAEPQDQAPRLAGRHVRQGLLTMRPVIYAFLTFAIIFALFIPPRFSGIFLPISGTPAAEFYDTIESLPSNSTVFVSFDYDPSLSGEMDLISVAILRHLIQRRVNIIALSTLDTGPLIAQRVLAAVTPLGSNYRYGTNFLNAGLVPGHESGLAQLATQGFSNTARDFDQSQLISRYPIAANIKSIKDVRLVIELAGTEETLKSWVEQFETRVNMRILVGASAAVEPKARTYRDANQLASLVSGPIGAAQYEILTKQPGEAVRRSTAQSAAQIVLIMVVVAGNMALWISRTMEKSNSSSAT